MTRKRVGSSECYKMKLGKFSRGCAHNEEEFGFHSSSHGGYHSKMGMVGRPDRG